MVDGSVSLDAASNGLSQLVKFDSTINGEFQRAGISLGTIGTVNTLP
jgi:hypothetical protein